MVAPIDRVKEELISFFDVQICNCQQILQKYIDDRVDQTTEHFRNFFAENVIRIIVETEAGIQKIKEAYSEKTGKQTEAPVPLEINSSETLIKRNKLFQIAKEKLPDLCTKEMMVKFKLAHNKEIAIAIEKRQLRVHQSYAKGTRAKFFLFLKEDVLNWVAKKWEIQ